LKHKVGEAYRYRKVKVKKEQKYLTNDNVNKAPFWCFFLTIKQFLVKKMVKMAKKIQ